MSAVAELAMTAAVSDRAFTQREVLNCLTESGVFGGLSDHDLSPFLKSLQILNFRPMDEVIGEGKFSAALYLVTAGRFMVLRSQSLQNHHVHGGEIRELDTFYQGDCFGEYSLLDQKPASASVVAAEASQAIQIPRRDFESVLMSDYRIAKTVYHNLAQILTARLRKSLKV